MEFNGKNYKFDKEKLTLGIFKRLMRCGNDPVEVMNIGDVLQEIAMEKYDFDALKMMDIVPFLKAFFEDFKSGESPKQQK